MDLFFHRSTQRALTDLDQRSALPRIRSPLGIVMPLFVVDDEPAPLEAASAQVLDGEARLFSYRTHAARAELLVVPLADAVADGGVRGCVGVLWRLATWADIDSLGFQCRWLAPPRIAKAIPVPGRDLDALVWEGGGVCVAIGTEDPAALQARARCGDGFPVRMREEITSAAVTYLDDGLHVQVPPLMRHEQCQLQFVLSWSRHTHRSDAWRALHRTPNDMLLAADVG